MNMSGIRILVGSMALFWSSLSMAATEAFVTSVTRLLVDDARFGNCMVYAKVTPTIDCPSNYFSMDCSGDFSSKEVTRRLWDAAQLAYALESRIVLYANDQRKHNGYCVVTRVDVVK